jgi:hypothetical protein
MLLRRVPAAVPAADIAAARRMQWPLTPTPAVVATPWAAVGALAAAVAVDMPWVAAVTPAAVVVEREGKG